MDTVDELSQSKAESNLPISNGELSDYSFSLAHNLIQECANTIVERHRDQLPDLSNATLFVSDTRIIPQCRQAILNAAKKLNHSALLGPNITTLQHWSRNPLAGNLVEIDRRAQELILVEALIDHKHLYGTASPWALANSLLELFEEISANNILLPDTEHQFIDQLEDAYGVTDLDINQLQQEAKLVFQLWQAMRTQLAANNQIDNIGAYSRRLHQALTSSNPNEHYYFVGTHKFNKVEQQFVSQFKSNYSACIFNYKLNETAFYFDHLDAYQNDANNNAPSYLDFTYQHWRAPLNERKFDCVTIYPQSPIANAIAFFPATHSEQEALAIDVQIRLWLQNNKQSIGFITNNRKLARRVRALLERSNITLQDEAGWNLSTTSTASVLENCLRCVETDFHYLPLLDLLKSPFLYPDRDHPERLKTVYRFEHGVVRHENIASNLSRYIQHTQYRIDRIPEELQEYYQGIIPLLTQIQHATQSLTNLHSKTLSPLSFLVELQASLDQLGITTAFELDDAGQVILDELQNIHNAAANSDLKINWSEFRGWLGHILETRQFQPETGHRRVQIMSLSQSDMQQFDGIIIGGAENEFMPGSQINSPFFNDGVRANLGLTTNLDNQNNEFVYFRQLLEQNVRATCPSEMLITYRKVDKGEDIIPSPWVEILREFHRYCYNQDLISISITELLADTPTDEPVGQQTFQFDSIALNGQSKAKVSAENIPGSFSASSYQQLVNCPYQFYAMRCLKLTAPDQIREYLEKSDYGERVHRCLQAFHSDVPGLPGPIVNTVNEANREKAIQLLASIAAQVFNKDIEQNFAHQAWLSQWNSIIPKYIDWLIERSQDWQVDQVETHIYKLPLTEDISITARLDRVDKSNNSFSVIDYKTGQISTADAVLSGEAVQLPFYAIASDQSLSQSKSPTNTKEIAYLTLNTTNVRLQNVIKDDALDQLKNNTSSRLIEMVEQLKLGKELTAWGDELVCQYCVAEGLCRKQYCE